MARTKQSARKSTDSPAEGPAALPHAHLKRRPVGAARMQRRIHKLIAMTGRLNQRLQAIPGLPDPTVKGEDLRDGLALLLPRTRRLLVKMKSWASV